MPTPRNPARPSAAAPSPPSARRYPRADDNAFAAWAEEARGFLPAVPLAVSLGKFAECRPADYALAGADGRRACELLAAAQGEGRETLHRLAAAAIRRLAGSRDPAAAQVLFTDAELEELAASLSATTATADMLGRARVHRMARQEEDRGNVSAFAEADPFDAVPDAPPMLAPEAAVKYFKALVPTLGVDPKRFGQRLDRSAFTLAAATEETLLARVKALILEQLKGPGRPDAPQAIADLLEAAGVTPANPQYSDMVYRTNMMDAYQAGASAELAADGMSAAFPVWQYLGIDDERTGADHRPKFNRYYPSTASFADVRGPRPYNCRCSVAPVSARNWERLKAQGATVEPGWDSFGESPFAAFAWSDWKQVAGGDWRSPGGRELSDPVFRRMKAAGEREPDPAAPGDSGPGVTRTAGPAVARPPNRRGESAAVAAVFGREVPDHDLRAMASAVEGATVVATPGLSPDGPAVYLTSRLPGVSPNVYTAERKLYVDRNRGLVCYNESLVLLTRPGGPVGTGADLLANQVAAMGAAGVKWLLSLAAGDKMSAADPQRGTVGYYVWPLLGYDGQIKGPQFAKLPGIVQTAMGASRSLRRLFDYVPGGAAAWKEFGSSIDVEFDLAAGSPSRMALARYLADREKKRGT